MSVGGGWHHRGWVAYSSQYCTEPKTRLSNAGTLPPPENEDERERKNSIVDWNGLQDPERQFNWPQWQKWFITLTACAVTITVGINSTSITAASEQISAAFQIKDASFPNSYWAVTAWTLGAAVVPLAGLPLMELYGVRYIYLLSYILFILFVIPQAMAQNFATLVATRFFAGGFGTILQNAAGEIISNLWDTSFAKNSSMSVYVWSLLTGLTIGPVVGGGILHHLPWRWIFYVQVIVHGILFVFVVFAIPEIRHHILLKRHAKKLRKQGIPVHTADERKDSSIKGFVKSSVGRPIKMLFTEFIVAATTLWSAFAFGTIFTFTQSIPQVSRSLYGWNTYQTNMIQSAVVIGELVALLISPLQNHIYARSAHRSGDKKPIPEARLYYSIFGSFLGITGGYFWYAWTSHPTLPWVLPAIGLALVGFGIYTIRLAATEYLTDSYSCHAAGAPVIVSMENVLAAFLPLATRSMYSTLSLNWASTLLGFISLVLGFAPVTFVVWGKKIRDKSSFI